MTNYQRAMTPRLAVRLWTLISCYNGANSDIRSMLEAYFDVDLLPYISEWTAGELDRLEAIEAILKEWLAAFQSYRAIRVRAHRDAKAKTKANEKPIPSARDLKPDPVQYCKCKRFKRSDYDIAYGIYSGVCARCSRQRRSKPTAAKRTTRKR